MTAPLFDTHAHYDDARYDDDRDGLLQGIHRDGVAYIVNIASDVPSLDACVKLAETYDFIYATCGLHPHEAKNFDAEVRDKVIRLTTHPKVRAVGEIGLDYFYDHSERTVQRKVLAEQIGIAKQAKLPIVIHEREAYKDCIDILRAENAGENGGVFHCYGGSVESAREILKLGFHISFTGNITFKKAHRVHEAAAYVPLERIMIETDCPYLTPEPHRGERNDSSRLKFIAAALAGIKGADHEQTAEVLFKTSKDFFKVG